MRFSNAAINDDFNNISLGKEKNELIDLSLIDDDSDAELFCNASIPSSSSCGQDFLIQENNLFLKTSEAVKQAKALSRKIGAIENTIESVQESFCNQLVPFSNTYPVYERSGQVLLLNVRQDRSILSEGERIEYNPNFSYYTQKMQKSLLPNDYVIPERTSGGFCIPNVDQTNYSHVKKNQLAISASYGKTGSRQRNTYEKFEM